MVGDAAGRIKPKDHSAVDRKFAENAGIRFYTPEVRPIYSIFWSLVYVLTFRR